MLSAPHADSCMRFRKACVGAKVDGSHHTACGQPGATNPVIAGKRPRYFGTHFDGSLGIQVQCQMASGSREAGGPNERPHLSTGSGHKLLKLCCSHTASNHGGMNRFRMSQLNLIVHAFLWLTTQ